MALIVGGTTVTGTQVLDATKLSGNLPALDGSSLVSLNASELDSGTVADGRISSGSVTQHVSAVTNTSGSWTPSASNGGFSGVSGRYHKTGNVCICFAHGLFSSRTTDNNNQFFVNGLPFTAKNSGDTVGGGICNFRNNGTLFTVIKANESRLRFYGAGADIFTTNTSSNESLSISRSMATNKNFRGSSNGEANNGDNFILSFYFITA